MKYRYTYDDLHNPGNNCVVTTIRRLSKECGLSERTLQKIFKDRQVHYDNRGKFKIEKRVYHLATLKTRER